MYPLNPVLERFIDRLTSNYDKTPDGNVYKLAQLTVNHIQENEDTLQTIGDWEDIDQAQGTTLDMHGKDVGQQRGQTSDEMYRVLIKSKILRNLSDGSINTIINFISFILQCDVSEIQVKELWSEGKPATLHIEAPVAPISATGLSVKQFGTLINLVVAGGVRAEVLFEGTFEFGAVGDPTDAGKGFADTAQTQGGTLGITYDPVDDFELPI
jgi:hypothetical protein